MESYVADWLNLGIRWLHFIAGVAWIGASLYFVMLDTSSAADGVRVRLAVHGHGVGRRLLGLVEHLERDRRAPASRSADADEPRLQQVVVGVVVDLAQQQEASGLDG